MLFEQQINRTIEHSTALKSLNDTDYKIIKCAEALILGLKMPYDVKELIAQRNANREAVNEEKKAAYDKIVKRMKLTDEQIKLMEEYGCLSLANKHIAENKKHTEESVEEINEQPVEEITTDNESTEE